MRSRLLLPLLLCCGGTISDFPPPAPGSVPYDSRIGPLLEVPGGETRIGYWLGGADQQLAPADCALEPGGLDGSIVQNYEPVNVTVVVESFELMMTEVSNRAYALCVDAGACAAPDYRDPQGAPIDWRAPDLANQPVLVGWDLAHDFCRHYGGDLPTAGEFSRAASGDAMAYSVPAMLDEWRACSNGASDAECARMNFQADWWKLLDVGADSTDVGPYGHHDLFTNAAEWMRGEPIIPNARSCETFAEHDLELKDRPWYGEPVYYPIGPFQFGGYGELAPQTPEPDGSTAYDGFRCAFPAN